MDHSLSSSAGVKKRDSKSKKKSTKAAALKSVKNIEDVINGKKSIDSIKAFDELVSPAIDHIKMRIEESLAKNLASHWDTYAEVAIRSGKVCKICKGPIPGDQEERMDNESWISRPGLCTHLPANFHRECLGKQGLISVPLTVLHYGEVTISIHELLHQEYMVRRKNIVSITSINHELPCAIQTNMCIQCNEFLYRAVPIVEQSDIFQLSSGLRFTLSDNQSKIIEAYENKTGVFRAPSKMNDDNENEGSEEDNYSEDEESESESDDAIKVQKKKRK